jgi:Tfp pilus assembly protein FimT
VPIVAERIRTTRTRTMISQLVIDIRAARWSAVSEHTDVEIEVAVHPGNYYEYTNSRGHTRHVTMPHGVRIVSATDPICFKSNGSVPGGASILIEQPLDDGLVSRWTVATNVLGVPNVTHAKVEP